MPDIGRQINSDVTIGGQPTREDLRELRENGFRAVINLRAEGESDNPLPPSAEGAFVTEELSMVYSHIPTSFDEQNDAMVDEFRRAIERVPKPVYVHCSELPRAAAMLMMHHATHAGMTGGEILAAWKDQYGFEPANETMEAFIRDYVNRRKEEG